MFYNWVWVEMTGVGGTQSLSLGPVSDTPRKDREQLAWLEYVEAGVGNIFSVGLNVPFRSPHTAAITDPQDNSFLDL